MADPFIDPETLCAQLGRSDAPKIIDMRTPEDAGADPTRLPGARVVAFADLERIPLTRPLVIYCQKGGKISQLAAASVRARGGAAQALRGGHLAWQAAGLPVQGLTDLRPGAVWVAALGISWSELAALWVLRRLIDPEAQILAVERDQIAAACSLLNAQPLPRSPAEMARAAALRGLPLPPKDVPGGVAALLAGRLLRDPDPLAALDLVDDLRAGQGVLA